MKLHIKENLEKPYAEVQVGMKWVDDEFTKECIKIKGNKCWIKEIWLSLDSDKEHNKTSVWEITKGDNCDILVDPEYEGEWYGKLYVNSAINLEEFYPDYLNEAHNITEVYTLHGYLDFQIDPSISKDFFVVYIYNKKIEGDPTPQLNKYSNSKLYFTDYQEGEDSFGYPQRACVVYVLNYPAARDYPSTEVALPDVKEVCNKVLGKNKYSLWDGDWGHKRWYNR